MHKDDPLSNLPPVENTDSSAMPPKSATVDFSADADHQGIFSGSDTRVETENLPEIPKVIQQAPMSSISPELRTTSTVTGDLKLSDATKKKRWPLIALGVAVVALIGAGVWALIGNSNPSTPQDRTAYSITDESRNLFNHYINFLIAGNDSTDKPDLLNFLANNYTYLSPGAMYADKLGDDVSVARSYFNDLNSMYSEFSQAFFPSNSNTEDIADSTEEYSRNAIRDYFYEAAKGSYLNLGQIASLYLQNGEESVRDLLETIFKSESENETVKSLLTARKRQMELYLNAITQADQDGCIANDSLNTTCANPRLSTAENEAIKLTVTINKLETELRKEAILNLENIYYAFYPDEFVIEGSTS